MASKISNPPDLYLKLHKQLDQFSIVERPGILVFKRENSEKGIIESVSFDGRKYEAYLDACKDGFSVSMLRQWKKMTIERYPTCLASARLIFSKLEGNDMAACAKVRGKLQGNISKLEGMFSDIIRMRKSLKVDFYKYTSTPY